MSTRSRAAGRCAGVAFGLAIAVVAMAPRGAWAQSESATHEAEARFREGLKHHDAGNEEGARLSFLEAYTLLKRPNLLFNLARAEQLTGHYVEAITHYKVFAADSTVAAGDRETARKHIVELSALVGHIQIDAPSGADLWIDGQLLPAKAPLTEAEDVSAGPHTVQARLGEETKTEEVSCEVGQTVTAKIEFAGAQEPAGATSTPESAEGGAPVRYVASGGKVATAVVLGVAAVVAAATGVALQLAASGKANDVTGDQQGNTSSACFASASLRCAQLSSDANAEATDENGRTGAFIGAGVLAVASVVAWMAWPNSKAIASNGLVVPIVSPGFAGLRFATAF